MAVAAVVQSFIFCNLAQTVKSASEKTSRAIFASSWYRLERIDSKRVILLMLLQSQRDVAFKSCGYTISLELFMAVSSKKTFWIFVLNGFFKNYFLFKCVFFLFFFFIFIIVRFFLFSYASLFFNFIRTELKPMKVPFAFPIKS